MPTKFKARPIWTHHDKTFSYLSMRLFLQTLLPSALLCTAHGGKVIHAAWLAACIPSKTVFHWVWDLPWCSASERMQEIKPLKYNETEVSTCATAQIFSQNSLHNA